jgi:hypothetical protein
MSSKDIESHKTISSPGAYLEVEQVILSDEIKERLKVPERSFDLMKVGHLDIKGNSMLRITILTILWLITLCIFSIRVNFTDGLKVKLIGWPEIVLRMFIFFCSKR